MKKIILSVLMLLLTTSIFSQDWQLKEIGVGIILSDSDYDKELKIIERGTTWNQKELYDKGAFSGRDKTFAIWIVGPHTNTYLNKYGVPIWSYKYIITYPNGKTQEFGKYGFYTPGFASAFINASQPDAIGKWKVDFYIWNRDTDETRFVGATEFYMNDNKLNQNTTSSWPVKDIGIGIFNDAKYDSELNIIKRGDNWSQSELFNNGNFSGRGNIFGTWIVGPHTNTYLNKNGVPIYSYKYKITYPDGSNKEFGSYGFYIPGFGTTSLMLYDSKALGKIKIDYYVLNRETNETIHIGTREFMMNK